MNRRNSISIQSIYPRPQILKFRHRLRLTAGRRAMHETPDQKRVGIRTDAKSGYHTYLLKVPTLNGSNHASRSEDETPRRSRYDRQQDGRYYHQT
jgi:hypothetical protein